MENGRLVKELSLSPIVIGKEALRSGLQVLLSSTYPLEKIHLAGSWHSRTPDLCLQVLVVARPRLGLGVILSGGDNADPIKSEHVSVGHCQAV